MPTKDRRAGPNGSRRRQRRETRALRAATLAGMIYRTLHPAHVRVFAEPVADETDATGANLTRISSQNAQIRTHGEAERCRPGC